MKLNGWKADDFTPAWPGTSAQAPAARPAYTRPAGTPSTDEATALRQFDLTVLAVFLGSALGAVVGVLVGCI